LSSIGIISRGNLAVAVIRQTFCKAPLHDKTRRALSRAHFRQREMNEVSNTSAGSVLVDLDRCITSAGKSSRKPPYSVSEMVTSSSPTPKPTASFMILILSLITDRIMKKRHFQQPEFT